MTSVIKRRISLRYKIAILVFAIAALSGAVGYAVQKLIVLPSFAALERQYAQEDLMRCVEAIHGEISHLDSRCHDWAAWDDTCEYLLMPRRQYIESNLSMATFQTNFLNAVYICDAQGRVIWGQTVDRVTEQVIQIPELPTDAFPGGHPLLAYRKPGRPLSELKQTGLLITSRGPLLVSARPIVTTNNQGPIRGTMILGRFLDNTLVQQICDQTHVNFRILPAKETALQPQDRIALNEIQSSRVPYHTDEKAGILNIYTAMHDLNGAPTVLLRADIPRDIMGTGIAAFHYALLTVVLATIAIMLALLLGLRKVVVRPIEELTTQITVLGDRGRGRLSLEQCGDDEIGELARVFDLMVRRLSDARESLVVQFQQAQKMETVGRLVGGVAHDFNNLLTAIHGYTDLLLTHLGTPEQAGRKLREIKKAADRASALTNQLLSFSRRQSSPAGRVNLNTVVAELENMFQRLIGEDIELATYFAPRLGSCLAESGQIEQIIMNLVVNARDAMPQGGRITIETGNAAIDDHRNGHPAELQPGNYVVLTVSDTGTGMDELTAARIFEPFFTTKEKGKGTGLGLSMVDELVRKYGGAIQVSSAPGKGSRFRVFFPEMEESAGEEFFDTIITNSGGGTETILVAEDDEIVRDLVRAMLQSHGYLVIPASTGEEALDHCRNDDRPIHLLLTDVVMPGMNGYVLAARLHALRPQAKVIYMSGYPKEEIQGRSLLPDEEAFVLRKPFSQEILLARIREVLNDRPAPRGTTSSLNQPVSESSCP